MDSQIPEILQIIFNATSQSQLNEQLSTRINEIDIDYAAVAMSVANIKAASMLSIGFKFAGTHSAQAKSLILETLGWFRKKIQVCPSSQPLGS
jgi:hypothetical protein